MQQLKINAERQKSRCVHHHANNSNAFQKDETIISVVKRNYQIHALNSKAVWLK